MVDRATAQCRGCAGSYVSDHPRAAISLLASLQRCGCGFLPTRQQSMSHAQDQADEVEALQAIFVDDFLPADGGATAVGAPVTAYRVRLAPEIGGDAKANHVVALLGVRYPPAYPEAPPVLELTAERGLAPAQLVELRALVEECAADNAGAPLVYVVAERVREWLQEHNEPAGEGSAYEEMTKRQRAKEREAAGAPTGE